MKKSVLALAVAAALAAPLAAQADTILYGSARVSVDYNDEDTNDPFNGDGNWDVVNNDSRLGVQGVEDLGGGLSAVYQYEFGVDVTEGGNFESNRPKFVGLKGGFGTVTLGTQETPYYHVAGVTDIFNSAKSFGRTAWLGGSFNGFEIDASGNTSRGLGSLTRLENSLYYSTPDFNGFSGEAMLVMNGAQNDTEGYSNNIDIWNIAAKYSNGPFFAGASYIALDGDSNVSLGDGFAVDLDLDQWNIGLGYSSGPFSVGFIYEQGKLNVFGLSNTITFDGVRLLSNDNANNWYLTGEYRFGNNTIRGAYGQLDTKLDVPGFDDKIDNYLVGYQYDFSKRTRVWIEYIGRSANDIEFGDADAVSIGTRVDF
ncbi:MAG TPA: porin [Candidatus Competibacteraceae bacterium]|nr:porin [Candidatus Competibacteraceae bacterium]HRZ05192.1 porin [Candidatus Competibacteraceae bacterium]HSA46207.1 porin [Candidatus Competibacteraceae bacterium]